VLPCLIYEDEDLLVVNKPAGLNTHAPSPYAGEGLYDWLRHREPRWAKLAIIHRLDKETSGVLVFAKTPLANRSLTEQFTCRTVSKKYLLLTDRPVRQNEFTVKSSLVRAGDKYASQGTRSAGGQSAETHFRIQPAPAVSAAGTLLENCVWLEAEPRTGRTHQIRVHAAEQGFPVLGDVLYGGTPAARVCLHAAEVTLEHPATGKAQTFQAPVDFAADARLEMRQAIVDAAETDAWRVIHGASDFQPHWYVDRLGDWLWSERTDQRGEEQPAGLERLAKVFGSRGAYHKQASSAKLLLGGAAPEYFNIRENGARFALSFRAGASFGLFLDQRDNRRRLLTGHVAAGFPLFEAAGSRGGGWGAGRQVLNAFAYTCGFSVCAALAGAQTTSIDLSQAHLEWGRRNFLLNQLDPSQHDFIYGDVFAWLRRLERKKRRFDVVLLDPPTFSRSKESGVFRAERDYRRLVTKTLPLLKAGGILFASTNAAAWEPEAFLARLHEAAWEAHRPVLATHYVPQPPDFPISRGEKAYLKTVWMRLGA
jgi:23S rRNA (cytosine1962-C5)-methyltransferase